jgi:hypothetical protein
MKLEKYTISHYFSNWMFLKKENFENFDHQKNFKHYHLIFICSRVPCTKMPAVPKKWLIQWLISNFFSPKIKKILIFFENTENF